MANQNELRQLPVLQLSGTGYYIDIGSRLFRETMIPGKRVDFDSVRGENLCRQAGIVTCLGCGMSALIAGREPGDGLRCMRCGRLV